MLEWILMILSLPERCELQVKKFRKNQNLSIIGTIIDEFYDDPEKYSVI